MLPPDHPLRLELADEVHARPPELLATPTRASYLALLVDADSRALEHQHLARLCAQYEVAPPAPGITQFSARFGELRLKWERHGEFSGWTLFTAGDAGAPFGEPASALLPAGWLAQLPGQTVVAAHADLRAAAASDTDPAWVAGCFGGQGIVGAGLGGGAGEAYTDFRIHADGHARFLLLDRGFSPRQAGRMLQRLFEIEAYRMLALLALPIAREQASRIVAIEKSLVELTAGMAGERGSDESLLQELTRLAAEVESALAASQFRFGACRAYADLVRRRITELRESRIGGIQTLDEFMARRFTPAVATCATVSQRLHDLSERVAQASGLLATRVGIARERQNQALLASMDRRAKLQLRLQQTVEGLSVAAIVYYVVGLVGYLAKAAKAGGVAVDPELTVGAAIPLVGLVVMLAVRRARRHVRDDEGSEPRPH
ncbi:MAG: DUF3422 domain-containing protein [Rubrivivax sp.]|nr:DUF3422 domain-containing protein [Rubrivivax sp.]